MILTKRPERMLKYMLRYKTACVHLESGLSFENIWLGVSVEDQKTADVRIPMLLQMPAAHRFVSVEPMLGAVDLSAFIGGPYAALPGDRIELNYNAGLDWVICGGENAPGARPMHPDWARGLRDQCQAADVPFFFKGWGEWCPDSQRLYPDAIKPYPWGTIHEKGAFYKYTTPWNGHNDDGTGEAGVRKVGKKAAGYLLDGKEYREIPAE